MSLFHRHHWRPISTTPGRRWQRQDQCDDTCTVDCGHPDSPLLRFEDIELRAAEMGTTATAIVNADWDLFMGEIKARAATREPAEERAHTQVEAESRGNLPNRKDPSR